MVEHANLVETKRAPAP